MMISRWLVYAVSGSRSNRSATGSAVGTCQILGQVAQKKCGCCG